MTTTTTTTTPTAARRALACAKKAFADADSHAAALPTSGFNYDHAMTPALESRGRAQRALWKAEDRLAATNPHPPTMTTQQQIRASFWQAHPHLAEQARAAGIISKGKRHHCATVTCSFSAYLVTLITAQRITPALAARTTL